MSVSGDDHSCHTTLTGQTVLAAPPPEGTFRISDPLVAVHGILIAFASSDASLIKTEDAAPSSSATLASSTTPTTQSYDLTATTSTGSTVVVTAFQTTTLTQSSTTITRTSPRTTSFIAGLASSSFSSYITASTRYAKYLNFYGRYKGCIHGVLHGCGIGMLAQKLSIDRSVLIPRLATSEETRRELTEKVVEIARP